MIKRDCQTPLSKRSQKSLKQFVDKDIKLLGFRGNSAIHHKLLHQWLILVELLDLLVIMTSKGITKKSACPCRDIINCSANF